MNVFRNSVAAAVVTALILAIIGLAFGSTGVGAETSPTRVSYLPISAGTYNFDPSHTIIGFSVKHLEIAMVKGRFKDLRGSVNYDAADVTKSTVEFSAKIDSIDTGVDARNAHLRTADFFDAAKYPEMTFKSTKVEKQGKGYVLSGDLTIKGTTQQVSFPFTITGAVKDPWGGTRFGIEAATTIDRRDFGITWGHPFAGGLDVANQVAIELHIEATKTDQK